MIHTDDSTSTDEASQSKEDGFTMKLGDKIERASEKPSAKVPGVGEYVMKAEDKIEQAPSDGRA